MARFDTDLVPVVGYDDLRIRVLPYGDMRRLMALDNDAQLGVIVELAIVDADGKRVFEDGAADALPWPAVVDLAKQANAANSGELTEDAVKAAEGN